MHGALAVTMEIVNCYLTSLLVRTQVNAAKQPTGKTLFLLKNQGSTRRRGRSTGGQGGDEMVFFDDLTS